MAVAVPKLTHWWLLGTGDIRVMSTVQEEMPPHQMVHAFPHFGMVVHLLLQFDLDFFSLPCPVWIWSFIFYCIFADLGWFWRKEVRGHVFGDYSIVSDHISSISSSFSYLLSCHMNVSDLCLVPHHHILLFFHCSTFLHPFVRVWHERKHHWAQSSHLLAFHQCCKIGGKSSPSRRPWERPGGWR